MAPAILDQTSVDILAGPDGAQLYLFRATGSVVKFPGFLKVYEESREADKKEEEGAGVHLPLLKKGERLDLVRLLPKQHFTKPPPRYSEASLIRALEKHGIGRPSTYAPTLATLQQRRYVERLNKKLFPTEVGFLVNDRLVEFFPNIVNVGFTSEMEEKLDRIATGEQAWVPMLQEFYGPFSRAVDVAKEKMPRIEYKPEPTGELCPECGRPLLFRRGRYGKFIGCSGWPECRHSQPIPLPGVSCPECGGPIHEKRTRRGRRFWGCANYRPDDETACQWATWKKPEVPAEAGAQGPEPPRGSQAAE
jgi:DNA topoisomerase-1